MSNITHIDRRHIWHPFTQHGSEKNPIVIKGAKGIVLYDEQGREILDLISSWWTCTHGHAHPKLNKALLDQAERMAHIMFAGFTHPPAAMLAKALADKLPGELNRVFFSDDGSTAVEVALKLAYQYWKNKGEIDRKLFIAFEGGYHGDTLGAMSVGRGSGYFTLFNDLMCAVQSVPYAETWHGDDDVRSRESKALNLLKQNLRQERGRIAALIIEPLMQGASGMRFCRPEFVQAVVTFAREEGILVIFDEVATGFGRTGTMFASEQIAAKPDIICLAKGLTAGYMPMSVTVARDALFEAFLGDGFDKALAHGHSFTANPLACAVAGQSLALFDEENTFDRIRAIEKQHRARLAELEAHPYLTRPRVLGTILACDLASGSDEYKSQESLNLKDWYLSKGLNIRPLGQTLYLMPPYCITDDELERAYGGLIEGVSRLSR